MTARSGGWFFGLVLLTAGCGGNCGGKVEPQASDKPAAEQPAASSVPQIAVVEGVVRLANGYELPSYRPEQMERKVLQHTERAPLPETCAPPKTTDRQPVKLASDGASLTGVLIAASSMDGASSARRPSPS